MHPLCLLKGRVMINRTKNIMIYMVVYTFLIASRNETIEKPLSSKKIKKIQIFEQQQQSKFLVHQKKQNDSIDLRSIKRRYPKKYSIVEQGEDLWPDDFGYNPQRAYHR